MARKLLLIGDPHFKSNNLDIMDQACQEILELVDQKQPDLIIILGDVLDTHERIYMRAQVKATLWLKELAKRAPLVVLIGNHDRENNQVFQNEIHPFVGLKGAPNIRIVDKATWDEDNNFIYVPYVPLGKYHEALKTVGYVPLIGHTSLTNTTPGKTSKDPFEGLAKYQVNPDLPKHPRFVFSHQEFWNCKLGSQFSSKGDPWLADLPVNFSGHIHEYQLLPGVVYVGTFYQQNFGESPDKALMFVTIENQDLNAFKPEFSFERIRLTKIPLKTTIHLNLSDLPNFKEKIPLGQVRVILHLDLTDTEGVEKNPHYQALKATVDKVVKRVDSNKASLAGNMVKKLKEEGQLNKNQNRYTLEELIRGMLHNDPYTLDLFNREVFGE